MQRGKEMAACLVLRNTHLPSLAHAHCHKRLLTEALCSEGYIVGNVPKSTEGLEQGQGCHRCWGE